MSFVGEAAVLSKGFSLGVFLALLSGEPKPSQTVPAFGSGVRGRGQPTLVRAWTISFSIRAGLTLFNEVRSLDVQDYLIGPM